MVVDIEYEIPPLRAIYFAQFDCDERATDQQIRAFIRKENPLWRIRKILRSEPNMTDCEKMTIVEAIQWYTDRDDEMGYEHRRYGACVAHLNGVVAIADEDGENGSSLEMFTKDDFISWIESAKKMFEEQGGDGLDELNCLFETQPEPQFKLGH